MVSVSGRSCISPACRFDLAPGPYDISARLAGYRPVTRRVTIDRSAAAPIEIALEPLPTEVSISTDLGQGTVRLNGRPAGSLRDGQFSAGALPPGRHQIEVSGEGERITAAIELQPGLPPSIAAIERSGSVDVLAVGNFGSHLTVRCRCDSATLDGTPLKGVDSTETSLDRISAGAHEIRTKTRQTENSFIFNAGSQPLFQLFLRAGSNTGTLLVDASEDGAAVLLNGRRYQRPTSRGGLSIALPPQTYTVAVEKPGFEAPSPQRVEVRKGLTERVSIHLKPLDGVLRVFGAPPQARVAIDGHAAGQTSESGEFSTTVPPGQHAVEISKPGYAPKTARLGFERGKATELRGTQTQLAQLRAPEPQPEPPKPVARQTPLVPPPQAVAPAPAPAPPPHDTDATEWPRLQNSRDSQALEEFRRKFPTSPNAALAARRIEQLQYEAVDQNDPAALRAYLQRSPNSPFAPQAQARIAQLEQRTRNAADTQAIQQTLSAYEDAFARKDLGRLGAVWPSMPKETIRQSFRSARSINVNMLATAPPAISGDTASVVCRRRLVQSDGRNALTNEQNVLVKLTRSPRGWIIQSITPLD